MTIRNAETKNVSNEDIKINIETIIYLKNTEKETRDKCFLVTMMKMVTATRNRSRELKDGQNGSVPVKRRPLSIIPPTVLQPLTLDTNSGKERDPSHSLSPAFITELIVR